MTPLPSRRTINRILERHGCLDSRSRPRRPPPPRGWYLPEVAAQRAELDSADAILELAAADTEYEVFTIVSLHGGLAGAFQHRTVLARTTVDDLLAHWRAHGLPRYVQFDNDTRFQGPHQHRDSVSRVTRLCLQLGVTPVFTIPHEYGFQAAIESFNGRWQRFVAARFSAFDLDELRERSDAFLAAQRRRHAVRVEAAPPREPLPDGFRLHVQTHPQGTIIYLRRTTDAGAITLLGRRFEVSADWRHRMVRAEVDLVAGEIRVFALRRRDPSCQPLLATLPYTLPRRRFSDRLR